MKKSSLTVSSLLAAVMTAPVTSIAYAAEADVPVSGAMAPSCAASLAPSCIATQACGAINPTIPTCASSDATCATASALCASSDAIDATCSATCAAACAAAMGGME